MSKPDNNSLCVLALDPASRGCGFAVVEGRFQLIDWGRKATKDNKGTRYIRLVSDLIERYEPDVLVVEDFRAKGARRCRRVQLLICALRELAKRKRIRCYPCSRLTVIKVFSLAGARTKHQIAAAIATMFPELAPQLPPVRKPWMNENHRMSIFDAVAFALTYFHTQDKSRGTTEQ
jgi:Holliday junction resolvasome RuvABC endonuclease subunit